MNAWLISLCTVRRVHTSSSALAPCCACPGAAAWVGGMGCARAAGCVCAPEESERKTNHSAVRRSAHPLPVPRHARLSLTLCGARPQHNQGESRRRASPTPTPAPLSLIYALEPACIRPSGRFLREKESFPLAPMDDPAVRPLRDALVQTLSTNPVRAWKECESAHLASVCACKSGGDACPWPACASPGGRAHLRLVPLHQLSHRLSPLSPPPQAVIKQAEVALQQAATQPGYAFALLKVSSREREASFSPRHYSCSLAQPLSIPLLSIRSSPPTRPSSCARRPPSTSRTLSSFTGRPGRTRTARRLPPSRTRRRRRCAA